MFTVPILMSLRKVSYVNFKLHSSEVFIKLRLSSKYKKEHPSPGISTRNAT
jgi:hypothetical protein